jgi:PEGA domain-containing protein
LAIKLAKGYRPSLKAKNLQGTGLLSANSIPKGATVFINDKLTTATDDTQNLPPGEYQIRIAKDGYISWEKTLILVAELVTQTNARLFPSVPNLAPLTFSGATNLLPSPDGQKIAFIVSDSTSDTKNGLYLIDLLDRPLSLKSDPRQITRNSQKYNYAQAQLTWSPDSNQLIASFNLAETNEANLLLNTSNFNDLTDIKDITARLPVIIEEWNLELDKKQNERLHELPSFMQQIATASADLAFFSPNEDKLMYTATASAIIPENLIPSLPASSTQAETRNLEPNNIYVYDLEEDKNFLVASDLEGFGTPFASSEPSVTNSEPSALQLLTRRYSAVHSQSIQWFPDSKHLIKVLENKIDIIEYDNTNHQTVYAGPFENSFAYPWPNGNRLVILASLNGGSNLPPNLYSIDLK